MQKFLFIEPFRLFAQTARAQAAMFFRAYQSPGISGTGATLLVLALQAPSLSA
ncbi:MAG: hypothetical protein H7274_16175 [Rhodoferax sp.]|nr:hypothetical protein [Rhodoferax sp.]